MHPMLQLREEHIAELYKLGITSVNHAQSIVQEAIKKHRADKIYPELNAKAGLCQRVLVNRDAFKMMMRWHIKNQQNPSTKVAAVAGK